VVSGASTTHRYLGPAKALDRIEPWLTLPEVADVKYWRGSAHEYSDNAKYNLAFLSNTSPVLAHNPQVNPEEFDHLEKLLAPK
jgi:hypothetical protein